MLADSRTTDPLCDLFGAPVAVLTPTKGRRLSPTPNGYYAPPGLGPAGETCGSCAHLYRRQMAKIYLKCDRARHKWTGGRKSDVLVRSPACIGWEKVDG